MIIDIHTHAFPDKIADKAIENLTKVYRVKAFSDGTITGLLNHMAESGVDVSVVQPVSTDPRQVVSINTWASTLSQIQKNGDSPIIGFGTIHPKFEDYRDEIQRMKELGIIGVKFQPSFQEFYPDDEIMFPIYEKIIKAGMVILFHAGDEIEPAPIVYSTPERLARVLDTMRNEIDCYDYFVSADEKNGFRKTIKFVTAHLGGYKMWDRVCEHLLGREIFFDASYTFGYMDSSSAFEIIKLHGFDRVVYGSDFPFAQQQKDIQIISKLDITPKDKNKILGENSARLLCLN